MKAIRNDNGGYVTVHATTKIEEASLFFIYHTDQDDRSHEFQICWKGDPQSNDAGSSSIKLKGDVSTTRYLMAPVSMFGLNSGPLRLESQGLLYDALFSLNSVLTRPYFEGNDNIPTKAWLSGSESCLIRCTKRKWAIDGYLAIKRVQKNLNEQQPQQEYVMCCESAPQRKDDGNIFMAFRLLKKSVWAAEDPTTVDNQATTSPPANGQASATESSAEQDTTTL